MTAPVGEAEELPLEWLEAELCELAARQAAAECRLLVMLGEFDRREGWTGWGIRSCAHWLSWKCGLGRPGEGAGAERAVTPATEELPLEYAACATTAQLEKLARRFRSPR